MDMAKHTSRFKYSDAVYAYVAKPMRADLDLLKARDPKRYGYSKVVQNALDSYVPTLMAKLGLDFKGPSHGAPGRRRRRLA